MKFLLDHDVSSHVFRALQTAKHDVIRVADVLPIDAEDKEVFAKAYELGCVMVTCNRDDYLKLIKKESSVGLIVVIRRKPPVLEGRRILRLLKKAGDQGLAGNVNFA